MASVKVVRIEINEYSKPRVHIEATFSEGRFTFPMDIEDQGSAAANEREAAASLGRFLKEIAEPVRLLTGLEPKRHNP